MTSDTTYFTPTEQKIIDLLNDGQRHLMAEMKLCLWDGDETAVYTHVGNLRRKLRPKGLDIVCEQNPKTTYRLMRQLLSPYDGKA
jgi:DNA-binding response OmpR family regulator